MVTNTNSHVPRATCACACACVCVFKGAGDGGGELPTHSGPAAHEHAAFGTNSLQQDPQHNTGAAGKPGLREMGR